ncbi:hypothetical protein FPOAC1_006585 [Fusarium poae]|uniref:hypothetical protein n=1 Tax=Fusarium poae TaxID=36050 RepID=UPI001CE85E58|nr:hypothetical protein FPOAC1_006585 [Fusarium poae]KAG8673274.1 hypothetical protein FPOAC1_006585 [Fusarium poae]
MSIRKGSPEARKDKLSFLDELTPEQMACYRPDQIATILRQRAQLKDVIAEEEFRRRSLALLDNTPPLHGLDTFMGDNTGEWAYGENKSFADGEIPPTAAAGFGFEALGGRPVIDKDVINHINEHRTKAHNRQMMELLEEQIARMLGRHHKNPDLRNVLRKTVFAPKPRRLPIVKKVAATGQYPHEKEPAPTSTTQYRDQALASSNTPDLLENPWPWSNRNGKGYEPHVFPVLPLLHNLQDVGWQINSYSTLPTFHPTKVIPGDFFRIKGILKREILVFADAQKPLTRGGGVLDTTWQTTAWP